MDDATARKIQKTAKDLAFRWGRPEIAEDLAQDAIIQQLRWPGLDIEYALINLLRKEYGSSRTPGGRARQMATARAIRLDSPVDDSDAGSSLHHELVGDPRPDPRHLERARDFSYLFGDRQAQIYRLKYEEDLSLVEIANIMGTTHSNISQQLMRMNRRIMREVGLEEVNEKLADDPGITQIEIDWIRL